MSNTYDKYISILSDKNATWMSLNFDYVTRSCCQQKCSQFATANYKIHYSNVIMGAMTSQLTGVSIVYSTVCLGADQRKHQSSASLAFVRGIHRWPVKMSSTKCQPFHPGANVLSRLLEIPGVDLRALTLGPATHSRYQGSGILCLNSTKCHRGIHCC